MSFSNVNDNNTLLKGYNMILYFVGSMIMYEPDEECVSDFWSDGMLATLPVKSRNPRFVEAASKLRESCKDRSVCTTILKEDFRRLFSGSGSPLASPVSSLYKDLTGYGNGKDNVSEFYNAYGWKFRSRYKIPDDHLGIELLFLTLMIDNYLRIDDEACLNEMRHEIRRFIEKHLIHWIPFWNELIQENASTTCYKGIGTMIHACTEDIYYLMDDGPGVFIGPELIN